MLISQRGHIGRSIRVGKAPTILLDILDVLAYRTALMRCKLAYKESKKTIQVNQSSHKMTMFRFRGRLKICEPMLKKPYTKCQNYSHPTSTTSRKILKRYNARYYQM